MAASVGQSSTMEASSTLPMPAKSGGGLILHSRREAVLAGCNIKSSRVVSVLKDF